MSHMAQPPPEETRVVWIRLWGIGTGSYRAPEEAPMYALGLEGRLAFHKYPKSVGI